MTDLLALISLYHSELVHTLRTPLAVVSNELQYVELTSDVSNVSKAKSRVSEMSDILKVATGCFPQGVESEVIDVFSLLGEGIVPSGNSFQVRVAAPTLRRTFGSTVLALTEKYPSVKALGSSDERTLCLSFDTLEEFTPRQCTHFYELKDILPTIPRLEMIAFDIYMKASEVSFQADISGAECALTYRFAQ